MAVWFLNTLDALFNMPGMAIGNGTADFTSINQTALFMIFEDI